MLCSFSPTVCVINWCAEMVMFNLVYCLYSFGVEQSLFVLQGPNYLWSVDGHEKAAQPFGLYIYGILDTFSRKALALHVLPNKKSSTVSNWLLGQICLLGGKLFSCIASSYVILHALVVNNILNLSMLISTVAWL